METLLEEWCSAVYGVMHDEIVLSAGCLPDLLGYAKAPSPACVHVDELSELEKRIVELLCQGLSNSAIASELKYSEATVKRKLSELMGFYGVSSRLQLAVHFLNPASSRTRYSDHAKFCVPCTANTMQ